MDMDQVFIVAIIFIVMYKVVELFVHRKERIILVDKIDKMDLSKENNLDLAKIFGGSNKYWGLKVGLLLMGVGLGLLVGYLIVLYSGLANADDWMGNQTTGVIYSASTLLFGGIGLLSAFLIERRLEK